MMSSVLWTDSDLPLMLTLADKMQTTEEIRKLIAILRTVYMKNTPFSHFITIQMEK